MRFRRSGTVAVPASRYRAFVSYSHAADGRLAPVLQCCLQRFARPWSWASPLRIFRDETDLSVNAALWTSVEQALGDSEYFLLLASPEAAASKWVHREAEFWQRHRRADTLLLILTAGEIAWQDSAVDFDWERTTALPRTLSGFFREQPRHIDLRWARTDEHLSLDNPQFRDSIAEIAAPLHGKSKAELESEELRQARRVRRLVRSAVASLACLATAAVVAAAFAFRSAGEARKQARLAEERRQSAVARLLAMEARSVLENADAQFYLGAGLVRAVLLGVESLKRDPTPQGTEVVQRALDLLPMPLRSFEGDEGSNIALSEGGRRLAATLPAGAVRVWDVGTGRALLDLRDSADTRQEIAISGDGRMLVRSRTRPRKAVIVTDVASGGELADFAVSLPPLRLALSRDGTLLAIADRVRVRLFNVRQRALLATFGPPRGASGTGDVAQDLAFTEDGSGLTVLWAAGSIQTLRVKAGGIPATPRDLARLDDEGAERSLGAVSGDGRRAATGDGTGTIQVWDADLLREIARVEHGDSYVQALALSADGAALAGVSRRGQIGVWALADGTPQLVLPGPQGWQENVDHLVALTGDGEQRVLVSRDAAAIDSIGAGGSAMRLPLAQGSAAVAANRDGTRIAVTDGYGVTRLYDTRSGRELARVGTNAEDYGGLVEALALSGDGARLAAGGAFETLAVLDVSTSRQVLRLAGTPGPMERRLVFALDDAGERLAVVSTKGELTVQHLNGASPPFRRALPSPAYRIAYSRDGQYIVIECLDRTLRVLDAATLEERARIPHRFDVAALAFAEGGNRVRIALSDGSVRENAWRPQDLIDRACAVVRRNLSPTEWPRYFPDEPFHLTCDTLGAPH